jgi:hypothetical protein
VIFYEDPFRLHEKADDDENETGSPVLSHEVPPSSCTDIVMVPRSMPHRPMSKISVTCPLVGCADSAKMVVSFMLT